MRAQLQKKRNLRTKDNIGYRTRYDCQVGIVRSFGAATDCTDFKIEALGGNWLNSYTYVSRNHLSFLFVMSGL